MLVHLSAVARVMLSRNGRQVALAYYVDHALARSEILHFLGSRWFHWTLVKESNLCFMSLSKSHYFELQSFSYSTHHKTHLIVFNWLSIRHYLWIRSHFIVQVYVQFAWVLSPKIIIVIVIVLG